MFSFFGRKKKNKLKGSDDKPLGNDVSITPFSILHPIGFNSLPTYDSGKIEKQIHDKK